MKKIAKLIISTVGGLFMYFAGYRFLRITCDCTRIGHLTTEVDCLIKEIELGDKHKRKYLLFYDPDTISNESFIELIPPFIKSYPLFGWRLKLAYIFFDSKVSREPIQDYVTSTYSTAKIYNINARWVDSKPVFQIPAKWDADRKFFMKKWGIPHGVEYVCIHAREGFYSPTDENYHSLRNVEIDTYKNAVMNLVSKGLVVIRMGDSSMKPLVNWGSLVFDYATCTDRAPWLDLALSANCLFFLGGSSGATHMATIFNKPVVSVGMSLPFSFSSSGSHRDIGIPKIFRHKLSKDLLKFPYVFESSLSEFRLTEEISQSDYELVENSPIEIAEVVEEMYLRLKRAWTEEPEDHILQKKMHALLRPGVSYSYGTASRCGALFLRRYKNLLDKDVRLFQ